MLGERALEELAAAASSVLRQQLTDDIKRNMRAALQSALQRLDLVTREELEVQQAVLARTRQKLQALEQQIAALERRLQESK